MIKHELRRPANDDEWRAFHAIRRKVLFENRGKAESYIENHPDDSARDNHPLILIHRREVIGVMRLDVVEAVAWLRRVAIREDLQRLGHGRGLLRLAEAFAKAQGCNEIKTNAAVESVGFYERCGYERDVEASSPANSVRMCKRLT
jgi:GNAT superfamily N-acetyltransferase